ncbi:MAG: helix-turn-helix transcriptional regulator [Bacteroidales bacterium]|nr:helix-turn-helix transcriptional regulator [Bacteroidales bacterium]
MKRINLSFDEMLANTSPAIQEEVAIEFAVSNRIYELMTQRGLTKLQFAQAIGKKPSEVTKWLSGQHNFTLRTISMLSTFFGQPIISIQDEV